LRGFRITSSTRSGSSRDGAIASTFDVNTLRSGEGTKE
jgi:hypothetical protein